MTRPRPVLALAIGLGASPWLGCTSAAAPSWTYAPPAASNCGRVGRARRDARRDADGWRAVDRAGGAGAAIAAGGEIAIDAFDLGFKPATIAVAARRHVRRDLQQHRLDAPRPDVRGRDQDRRRCRRRRSTGTVTVPAGGLAFICSIPGHADAGMKGDGHGRRSGRAGGARRARRGTARRRPGRRSERARRTRSSTRRRPTVLPGTVHDIDLPIIEKDITVADGLRRPRLDLRRARSRARRSGSTSATRSAST